MLGGAGAALALGIVACADSGAAPAGPAPIMLLTQADAGAAAEDLGFAFEDSRAEGEAMVFTGVRYAGEDGTVLTADTLRVTGMGSTEGAMQAERIVAEGLAVTLPQEEGATGAPAVLRAAAVTLDEAAFGGAEGPGAGFDALAFGSMTADGLTFETGTLEAGGAGPGNALTVTTSALRVGGYERGLLGPVTLDDVGVVTAGTPREDVAQAAAALGPAAASFLDSPLGRMLTATPDRTRIERVRWGGLDLRGVRADLMAGRPLGRETGDVVVGDLIVRGQTSLVGEAVAERVETTVIEDVRFDGAVPLTGTIRTEGVLTDLTAYADPGDEDALAVLSARGLGEVPGSGVTRWAHDPEAGRFSLTSEQVSEGLSSVTMALDVTGLGGIGAALAAGETARDEATAALLGEAALSGFTLSLTDEQMLDTAFALAALGGDQSAMELRQQAVGIVTLGALQGGAVSPRVPGYAGAVSSFLQNGGTLTIRMAPAEPLSAAGVQAALSQGPAALLDAADLTVTRAP